MIMHRRAMTEGEEFERGWGLGDGRGEREDIHSGGARQLLLVNDEMIREWATSDGGGEANGKLWRRRMEDICSWGEDEIDGIEEWSYGKWLDWMGNDGNQRRIEKRGSRAMGSG
ncbi:unnamed protein product [Calypogeia fissa]